MPGRQSNPPAEKNPAAATVDAGHEVRTKFAVHWQETCQTQFVAGRLSAADSEVTTYGKKLAQLVTYGELFEQGVLAFPDMLRMVAVVIHTPQPARAERGTATPAS